MSVTDNPEDKTLTAFERWEMPQLDTVPTKKTVSKSLNNLEMSAVTRGFEKGLQAGRAQGLKESKETLSARLKVLDALKEDFMKATKQYDEHLLQAQLLLINTIVEKIICQTFAANPEIIKNITQKAIAEIALPEKSIEIEVNSANAAFINELICELSTMDKQYTLKTNDKLDSCDAKINMPAVTIDATLKARFAKITDNIFSTWLETDHDSTNATKAP